MVESLIHGQAEPLCTKESSSSAAPNPAGSTGTLPWGYEREIAIGAGIAIGIGIKDEGAATAKPIAVPVIRVLQKPKSNPRRKRGRYLRRV